MSPGSGQSQASSLKLSIGFVTSVRSLRGESLKAGTLCGTTNGTQPTNDQPSSGSETFVHFVPFVVCGFRHGIP